MSCTHGEKLDDQLAGQFGAQLAELAAVGEELESAATQFLDRYQDRIDSYRREISVGWDGALGGGQEVREGLAGGTGGAGRGGEETAESVGWMQWSVGALPAVAGALGPEPADFRRAVTACGLVYTAIRIFDDLV